MDDSTARKLAGQKRLLWAAHEGNLDALECTDCGQHSVSVWFTHPGDGIYRTWFICTDCSFELRAQNLGCPPHYSEDRVSEHLENYDERALARAIQAASREDVKKAAQTSRPKDQEE